MQRHQVRSSNILAIGYDADERLLEIEFRGGSVYQYFGVPDQVHAQLMAASSHGQYFNGHVRETYRYRQVR